MDATTWISHRDYRLFKGDRLAVIDTEDGNTVTLDGKITDSGTYRHLPTEMKAGIDATTFFGHRDYRLFKGSRLVSIDCENGNSVVFDGKIADHGTYHNVPEDFQRGIDATTLVSHRDYRLFKGPYMVCVDTENGNSVTFHGLIADHGTYAHVPDDFKQGITAATWISYRDYRLFKGGQLVCIDPGDDNRVTFHGRVRDHGTYANLSDFWGN